MLNWGEYNSFFDKPLDYLNTTYHLNFKSLVFVGTLQVLKFEFLKFTILEILNFHPWDFVLAEFQYSS